ncbi:MAG: SDR family oxidoreductase [Chloroflexi bacterium]|nr:SDR family oxidoreductase [Chloroflexota bacterium]
MDGLPLRGKTVLVTGAAKRIGRALALACARAGADVFLHYATSATEARRLQEEIQSLGTRAWRLQSDLSHTDEASRLIERAAAIQPLDGLVNNASIFGDISLNETTCADWDRHLAVNLTAPFLLSQAFARQLPTFRQGRIVNLLDWRALQPGADHFPYTLSKAALAALTQSLAAALAPAVTVNGLALGAILPPATGSPAPDLVRKIPAGRWGSLEEVENALLFLLSGPGYITGEILRVDGGRHLV